MEKRSRPASRQALQSIIDELKKSHLKVTEPRKAVLQALSADHGPFTAEELHKRVTKRVCDLATIYRCLSSLEKAGLIKRCEFGDGAARYEITRQADQHHHHVICNECKKIEVLDDCELDGIDKFARKRGFSEVSHSLEFFGICSSCKSA